MSDLSAPSGHRSFLRINMPRNLTFCILVVACIGGLAAFWVTEGTGVIGALDATKAFEEGVQILADPSLTPHTREELARERFRHAMAVAPQSMMMPHRVLKAYKRAKLYEIALALYMGILQVDRRLPTILEAAECAYLIGDLRRARPLYEMAIELYPDDPTAYNGLGYFLAEMGVDLDEAEGLIKKALELNQQRWRSQRGPLSLGGNIMQRRLQRFEEATYRDSLGWVYYKQGRYEDAWRELHSAAQVLGGQLEVRSHLDAVRQKLLEPPAGHPFSAPLDDGAKTREA